MNLKIFYIFSVVFTLLMLPRGTLHAQYEIEAWILGSGGGASSNDSFRVISTVGQPLIGIKQSDDFLVQSGFWYAVSASIITGVEQRDDNIPDSFRLEQNFPNPFNPSTTINFALPEHSQVTLEIYNILGQRVRTLIAGQSHEVGSHNVIWDGRNDSGMLAVSGVYYYRIQAGEFSEVKKMLFLK
jgi:hypothetical protein